MPDPHSYAVPALQRVIHIDLDLRLDMATQVLSGTATLTTLGLGAELTLDTNNLTIHKVQDVHLNPLPWRLAPAVPFLGQALTITMPASPTPTPLRDRQQIKVTYTTSPDATALQWLSKEAASSTAPFMFSQGQTILTRSWIPCQDTPRVRASWSAKITSTVKQTVLMSGLRTNLSDPLVTHYKSPHPVPSYLIAIAAGDLVFRSLGPRTGIWALPDVADSAASEFFDLEAMVQSAERLFGPYDWGRFDALILPPSFPFGGMENPCLTFITPTLITGDRSLVATVVHELAHAWSGNKITNNNWSDTWLNEGLTVYAEHRLLENLYGQDISDLHRAVDGQILAATIKELGADHPDTHLVMDLTNRDPDDAFTFIPYYKGVALWRRLEQILGRVGFDLLLKTYVKEFSWQSIAHQEWLAFWRRYLTPDQWTRLDAAAWLHGPAIPPGQDLVSFPPSSLLADALNLAPPMLADPLAVAKTKATDSWRPHQWIALTNALPDTATARQLQAINEVFKLSTSPNPEVRCTWCLKALNHGDYSAWPGAADLVSRIGRMKLVAALYKAMLSLNPVVTRLIYQSNRPKYHSLLTKSLDSLLKAPMALAR